MAEQTEKKLEYSLGDVVHQGQSTVVYRATLDSGEQVIVKVPRNRDPGLREMAKLQQEFEFGKALAEDAAVRPLMLQESSSGVALILEDFGGMSLKELIGRGRLAVRSFLKIARILASHLATIHGAGIIHKDIKPANILVNPDTNTVKFIDFGISTRINLKNQHLGNPETLEGTLAYISPEQTGRMNRIVDSRSDLYSLGVTFYEILTGRLPFETRDSMELVHCHIARVPEPVHEVNPKVPRILSDIVTRLMAKNAEDRYQSAIGLRNDLDECLERLKDGEIETFDLGTKDFSGTFKVPEKLYGRDNQLTALMSAFERAATGRCEMVLVKGFSGVGKSALVNEVHRPITEKRGNFIAGKFDQLQKGIPYYAISQAFEDLCQLLLTESADRLDEWKQKILDAVGDNGQVLVELIPGLEHVIGSQPAVPELGPQESQNRFIRVFQGFLRAISRAEHPLVLFIDDLQWADNASLALLKALVADEDNSHFLFIGAYRDNEVDASHPLMSMVESLRKDSDVISHEIAVSNLALEDVTQLVSDALQSDSTRSQELAGLIFSKTQGNAFFTAELLKDLYENGHLRFDYDQGWTWDVAYISKLGIQDNVVELMTQKLTRLSPEAQGVLQFAACIGNKFDLRTLAVIHEKNMHDTLEDLWPAIEEEMILPMDESFRDIKAEVAGDAELQKGTNPGFRFAHDRVQQASYGLIDEQERKQIHLRIGNLLLKSVTAEHVEDRLFDIVNQYNEGRDYVTDPAERNQLAEYNWRAAAKASKSSAFESTVEYLNIASTYLDADRAWDENHDLIWNIYADRASAEFSCTMFEESERDILYALDRCETDDERVRLYQIYLAVLFQLNRHEDGVDRAREALRKLGVSLPKKIGKVNVGLQYVLFRLRLGFRKAASLKNLKEIQNARVLNICKILYDMVPSAYIAQPDTMGYICVYMARLCLRYGNSMYSAFAYAMIALVQAGVTKEYKTSAQFMQLAMDLNEKNPDVDVKGRVHFTENGFTGHWTKPVMNHVEHMQIARQCFRDTGNLHWRNYAVAFSRTQSILFYNKTLPEIDEENVRFYDDHYRLRDREVTLNQYFLIGFIRKLRGMNMDDVPDMYDYSEEMFEKEMRTPGNFAVRTYFFTFKMIEAYTFEQYEEALKYAKDSFKIVLEVLGLLLDQAERFYFMLSVLAQSRKKSTGFFVGVAYRLNRFLLRHAAKNMPENFQVHYSLVLAEEARYKRKWEKAGRLYDTAIQEAEEAGYPIMLCLGNELAARCFAEQGKDRISSMYLHEAHRHWARWGAVAKVRDLEQKHPELRLSRFSVGRGGSSGDTTTISATTTAATATSTGGGGGLDMSTVVKATQAISGEIKLENLLSNLMKNVIENAGAQRACLLLEKDGALFLEAEDTTDTSAQPSILKSIPLSDANVPTSVMQYSLRTGQDVVLENAAVEGRFTRDDYIAAKKTKSLISHVITKQGRLVGIMYLENDLATGAFTPDRLEVLGILGSQAAISLENSRLVAEETERQKLQKEMEMAKHVQMSILPNALEDDDYNIAAHMTPAEQVGGDYYDYYRLDGHRWIAIGDVTGHGLNSGLLMLMAQTGFSAYLNSSPEPDTLQLFSALNKTLHENMANRTKQNLYMTFTALKADAEGNFEHVGKHEDILVWRKSTGKVEVIQSDGVWMGIVPTVDERMISKAQFHLAPGDFIILYTDGVIECRNESNEQFDTPRLIEVIETNAEHGIETVRDRIVEACFKFMSRQDDDVTLFLMEKK